MFLQKNYILLIIIVISYFFIPVVHAESASFDANDLVFYVAERQIIKLNINKNCEPACQFSKTQSNLTATLKFNTSTNFNIVENSEQTAIASSDQTYTLKNANINIDDSGTITSIQFTIAILDLLPPNALQITGLTLNNIATTDTSMQPQSLDIQYEANYITIPWAFCLTIENPDHIDGTNETVLFANKEYKLKQQAIGCPKNENCPTELTQTQLNNMCNTRGYKITNNGLNNYQKYLQDSATTTKKLNSISKNITEWAKDPANSTEYLAQCRTSNDSSEMICSSTITYTQDKQETDIGYSCNNATCINNVTFDNIGWFSFSSLKPTTNNKNILTYYHSPIYTVVPSALQVTDITATYDKALSYYTLHQDIVTKTNVDLPAEHRLTNNKCPLYYGQRFSVAGRVALLDYNNKIIDNWNANVLTHTYEGIINTITWQDNGVTINNAINDVIELESDTQPIDNYKDNNNSNNFLYSAQTKTTLFEAKDIYLGVKAQVTMPIAKSNSNIDIGTSDKYTAYTMNNISEQLNKLYDDKITTETEAKDETPVTTISYDTSISQSSDHIQWLPLDLDTNPLKIKRGRITSQVVHSRQDIYIPLIIQDYDNTTNTWNIDTNNSCTPFLIQYLTFSLPNNNKIPAQSSNGPLKIWDENIGICTSYNNKNSCIEDTNFIKHVFQNGILWLRIPKPQSVNNDSHGTFILNKEYNDDINVIPQQACYIIDYLMDKNTSQGGFAFTYPFTNPRIVGKQVKY